MPRLDAIARRIVEIRLPPPYDVLHIKACVSYTRDQVDATKGQLRDLLALTVVEHDILGPDDKPLPVGVPEFCDALTPDLASGLWSAILAEVGAFPPVPRGPSRST